MSERDRLKYIEYKLDEILRNQRILVREICDAHNIENENMSEETYTAQMDESIFPKSGFKRRNWHTD